MIGRARTLMIAAMTLAVGACGFTPMYANPQVSANMRAIAVVTPQTRVGYLLREQLNDQLAVDRMATPRYRLTVAVVERRRPRGLNPDDTPTRYELHLDVTYTLAEAEGGKVILKKMRPVFVSADAVVDPYASVAAQQDSQQRAAEEAAEIIRTDVSLALAGK